MIYVFHVGVGGEDRVERFIRQFISEERYRRCFHPVRHMKKKIRGRWVEKYETLIPGYVFVETEDIWMFYQEARELPTFLRLLGKETNLDENYFHPLPSGEVRWLRKATGLPLGGTAVRQENPVAELTKVRFDEEGKLQILSGPLAQLTGQVRKINVHRRIAEVEVEFMGRMTILHLGIELVE